MSVQLHPQIQLKPDLLHSQLQSRDQLYEEHSLPSPWWQYFVWSSAFDKDLSIQLSTLRVCGIVVVVAALRLLL